MRSRIAVEALAVNRSFGIHGMSMWQSAEIREYCIAPSSRGCCAPILLQDRSHQATIDQDRGAGDIARLAGSQERDQVSQLLGLPDASHGGLGRPLRQRLVDRDAELLAPVRHVRQHPLT